MKYNFLETHKIVPVVVINKLEDTIPTLSALSKGGINVAEITFRTSCAEDAIKLASSSIECAKVLIGAGTVINKGQCLRAIKAGAKFIVSPGFSKDVFKVCKKHDIPYLPGVCTPTEIMMAKECGLNILKFFPAGAYGGIKTLKALSAAFPDVKFLPTGGVDASNMNEFFAQKFIAAIGGSWMVKGDLIAQGKFDEIERLSKEAVALL
ncbi:MAG: bifunctional 4-hydroxy-2-oxoglutarate aldolase/2-dehydro-3-deoxy-phosphogluconate aldolase [Treponemataceae bacterium]|nr:bifunctional 4-hydroxy-2-oxoglutarate aldolase/2-dehydro-3-deoxy-phosphogluconate aldolase [Treponemataceae bacterium]